jgi:hypothetical protein
MGYRLQEDEHPDNDYVLYDYLDSANQIAGADLDGL